MLPTDISPRVDAQASETRTGIGGWLPVLNARGVPDPWLSPWFSVEITPEVLPWVYEKGGKLSLIIWTLEATAVLVSLKMFYGEQPASGKKKVTVAPTWTDDRGNGSALNKLMTTKFPACAVLMELPAHVKRMSMKVVVEWTPRTGNREADSLANGEHSRFSPQNRVDVDLAQMQWNMLPDVLSQGKSAEDDVRRLKESGQCLQRNAKRRKRKPDEPRETEGSVVMHVSQKRCQSSLVFSFRLFFCFSSDVSSTGTSEVGVTRVGSKPTRQFERGSSKLLHYGGRPSISFVGETFEGKLITAYYFFRSCLMSYQHSVGLNGCMTPKSVERTAILLVTAGIFSAFQLVLTHYGVSGRS